MNKAIPGDSIREHKTNLPWVRLSLAFLLVAFAYLYRLDRPLLWGDEADTGVAARNVLQHGYPVEYDGRNLSVYESGSQLNQNLIRTKVSWSQFYVGALSLKIFGDSTEGLRLLFALCGLMTFVPVYLLLKSRVQEPEFITALILLAPQCLLFQRNARYYPLLTLAYAILLWHLATEGQGKRMRWTVALLVFVFLFQTHSFSALCCSVSLLLYCWLFRRRDWAVYAVSIGVGCLSWLTWLFALGPSIRSDNPELKITLIGSHFGTWLGYSVGALAAEFTDFDVVNSIPILLWVAALVLLFCKGRPVLVQVARDPVVSFVVLGVLVQAVATAAVFGYESVYHFGLLRYMPHLLIFAPVACLVVLNAALPWRRLYVPVCLGAIAFNFTALSFWTKPRARSVPVSWFPPVYAEVLWPRPTSVDAVIDRLRSEARHAPNADVPIVVWPAWTDDVLRFYLGESYRIRPIVDMGCEQSIREKIGDEAYRRLFAAPEWLAIFGVAQKGSTVYDDVVTFPGERSRTDEGTRPELTRHTFPGAATPEGASLWQRRVER